MPDLASYFEIKELRLIDGNFSRRSVVSDCLHLTEMIISTRVKCVMLIRFLLKVSIYLRVLDTVVSITLFVQ